MATKPKRQARYDLKAADRKRNLAIQIGLTSIVVIFAVVLVGYIVLSNDKKPQSGEAKSVRVASSNVIKKEGSSDPKVVLSLYEDFLCPHCRDFEDKAADTLAKLVSDGAATVVYHPLAFLDSASSTKYSSRSAAASGCAADAGTFVEYAAALYAQQPAEGSAGLSETQLVNLASVAGITDPAFEQCVRTDKHLAWVDGVTEQAVKKGVRGTPTIMVNGQAVDADPQAITDAVAKAS